MRFEGPLIAFKFGPIDQLRVVRLRRPTWESSYIYQRCVLLSVPDLGLYVELQCFDIGTFSLRKVGGLRQLHSFEAMEKSESYPALLEQFVHRRKDCISHAGVHLPEDSAARTEQHPQGTAQ